MRKLLLLCISALIFMQCAANRLGEYTFRGMTAAAKMSAPPRAGVFNDSFWVGDGEGGIVGTIIRVGTTIAKEIETSKAQKRLDSAMEQVDIPELIREETLNECADYFDLHPVSESRDADFLYMMRIKEYGIEAQSWDASVFFKLDIEIQVIDNIDDILIWKKTFHERMHVTGSIFGFNESVGDIITAASLSSLSEEEMVDGFSSMAVAAADIIADRIYRDYVKKKSEKRDEEG